ncbi:PIN domain nuclease [Mycobacterium riyadhense]|uniref:PIN domain nuclease n=1 Tax=Mycobacterium riyadhense TaxID=486698 RepID=UPI000A15B9BE|nr:PIN domain nuclease [Mycobacterium riyadhense]MCV7146269.1 PIN domain nuclease [Mycobacterium riyadhense]
MTEGEWLIDKSALVRLGHSSDRDLWANRIERGLVHISNLTRLEIGYSARSGDVARREFREPPLAAMPVEYLTPKIEDRALEVQILLADRGQHRGPSIPDLIIAATAELSGLTILHVDNDFDTITAVTGQPATRLAYASTAKGGRSGALDNLEQARESTAD